MSVDLTDMLNGWPFEPGKINVRLIHGIDGEPRVQIRLDLGILQMHVDGRPDGARPEGYESYLEYCEAKLDLADEDTTLSAEDCRLLREEAVQYYHRYVAMLVLEDYERVLVDTTRNLRVLDVCSEHAEEEDDREILEQYRPYIVMMRARALASQALAENEANVAVVALDEGLDALRRHFTDKDMDPEQTTEVQMLRSMKDSLVPRLPVSQQSELNQRLREAVQQENYELAAILRDELRLLRGKVDEDQV
ncbi:MAG: UvrB/UvrC motif-containing protein [Phycisphaerales bacterium]|nr:UvrB/UvrC motif-containing protein [Phycisphaerales bacterium]